MSIIPARTQDRAVGIDYLMHCYDCGHYEPWDTDEPDSDAYGDKPQTPNTTGESGYQWCACRDCFDIVIAGADQPTLCSDCQEAGCEIGEGECQRDDSYDCQSQE
ncbi:hypothetical protein [Nocardia sp. NPDC050710]|uniref:hypothetical protein n=1 Tax=Nocardia sp. NPDC050710 TaxID=3157220 RepID=UPI0033C1BAAE